MARICPCRELEGFQELLVALTHATALKRDNWSPRDPRGRNLGHFDGRFRQLLGDSEQMFAPLHLAPHVLGPHARRRPQNGEIIEKIGALPDHRVGIAVDGVDHDFRWLLRPVSWPSWPGRAETAVRFAKLPDRDPWPRSLPDKAARANHSFPETIRNPWPAC